MGDSSILSLRSSLENFVTFGQILECLVWVCVHMFMYLRVHIREGVCAPVCVCACIRVSLSIPMLEEKISSSYVNEELECKEHQTLPNFA